MRATLFLAAVLCSGTSLGAPPIDPATQARIDRILKETPLIDGHNDIAEQLHDNHQSSVAGLASGTGQWPDHPLMTDMARLRQGRVGGQFWSVYIDASYKGDEAIRRTIEEIDIVDRMMAAYPNDLERAGTADDIVRIHKAGKVASLMGIEGGDQIGGSMAALRQFYRLGARYMTLTHWATTDWADSATDDPKHGGLTPFGVAVVREMNRLGMLVDLSHVSEETMNDALDASKAPVIFSHSSTRSIDQHTRNVPDAVLRRLASNGGVVMINVAPGFVSEQVRQWSADRAAEDARLKALYLGLPTEREARLKAWVTAHPQPHATLAQVADHIDHAAKIAGHDYVGIGADLDGIDTTPDGLSNVADYPNLFAELIRRGWSDADLAKLAGGNLLRAMRRAEAVAREMRSVPPAMDSLPPAP